MISYLSFRPVSFLAVLLFFSALAHAKSDAQTERVTAAFMLVTGSVPSADEVSAWVGKGDLSLDEVVAKLKAETGANLADRKAMFLRAYKDAFGVGPEESSMRGGDSASYVELMQGNIALLIEDKGAYAKVIGRAYQFVVGRDPYEEEIAYWEERGTLSYALLVGCMEDWARRNQPGLMVTNGEATVSVNCGYLSTFRVSREVAEEARAFLGLEALDESHARVIAVGAGELKSMGGVHFLAVGGSSRQD